MVFCYKTWVVSWHLKKYIYRYTILQVQSRLVVAWSHVPDVGDMGGDHEHQWAVPFCASCAIRKHWISVPIRKAENMERMAWWEWSAKALVVCLAHPGRHMSQRRKMVATCLIGRNLVSIMVMISKMSHPRDVLMKYLKNCSFCWTHVPVLGMRVYRVW